MASFLQSYLSRAERLAKEGDTDKSAAVLREILDKYPGNRRAKEAMKALQELRSSVYAPPVEAVAQVRQMIDWEQWKPALEVADRMIARWPASPIPLALRARALVGLGRPVPAAEAAAKALAIDSDFGPGALALGLSLAARNMHRDAITCYVDSLRVQPGDIDTSVAMANSLFALMHFETAINVLREALGLHPDAVKIKLCLIDKLIETDETEEARQMLENLLAKDPQNGAALNKMAVLCVAQGNRAEAVGYYERALRLIPGSATLWSNYSHAHTFTEGQPELAVLDAQLTRDDLNDFDRARLWFAKGKACHDTGQRDAAFAAWTKGNAYRRTAGRLGGTENAEQMAKIRRVFDKPLPAPLPATRSPDVPRPIFVLGMPRSGTTLTEQIIGSHPEVHPGDELNLLAPAVNRARIDEGPLTTDHLETIRTGYLAGIGALGKGERAITDKMPFNYRIIGHILLALPEAKILHLKRDPRATCWSIFRTHFTENGRALSFAWNLQDIVDYHLEHDRMIAYWEAMFPGRIHNVPYEALTADPEAHVREMLHHVGLGWDPACMEFHKNHRSVHTASAMQVRQPIYTGSSEEWRRYIDHLGPVVEAWGDGPVPRDTYSAARGRSD
ncbi:sulfotransferase [Mesobacterium pallidum]|uniref:sulfotransferase n=1 Tax=Mesobacterium pallidum TaxID=2872037 RepID=UPI001EE28600|nr:tetratricopeptide repeat-containing sulfotransferase family protein [Mesobacterium pallidum]